MQQVKCTQGSSGPGFCSPQDAIRHGKKEKIMYVVCINPNYDNDHRKDYLATVDIDPNSATYCQVISRLETGVGEELHHTGWNVCSSCRHDTSLKRDKLLLPGFKSSNIYVADMGHDPRNPRMHKVIKASEMQGFDCTRPHTVHCTDKEILVSTLGDNQGEAKAQILRIDHNTYEIKGPWIKQCHKEGSLVQKINYDFWYQPYHDVMILSEFGPPNVYEKGFNPAEASKYGRGLNFYSWKTHKLEHQIDLGPDGMIPLEVRFLHNPKSCIGFVGCALSSNIVKFQKNLTTGSWSTNKVIQIPALPITGWALDHLPGLITDILISMDDKFLYFSNWLQGDIRQYDISDPDHPKLSGQVFVGGINKVGSNYRVEQEGYPEQREYVRVKGKDVEGGPQMLQLSLDGKRLYVTNSLYSVWDNEFYPDLVKNGGCMLKIHVDNVKGGMKLDEEFIVDFGKEPGGPVLGHEMRYPGGDCSSDVFLVDEHDD